jgi:uncharacterized protein
VTTERIRSERVASNYNPSADAAVLPVRERIQALDVLRGVAVCGILIANVMVFFGLFAMPSDRMAALPTAAADNVARFLEHVLVDGKFYSVFSLLFGIGFGVQLSRGGEAAVPRLQIPLSAWWLSRYRFGPIEWVWRRLTYGRPI